MTQKEIIQKELEDVPDDLLGELADFVTFLKMKAAHQANDTAAASERSLAKDWLRGEEDEAWQDL